MRPEPWRFIPGATARQQWKVPPTLTSKQRRQSAGSSSSTAPSVSTPALFTSTSIRPNRSTAAATARSTDDRSVTSTSSWSSRSAGTFELSGNATSSATTSHPSAPNRSAIAAPMPRPAPVTTTTRPLRSRSTGHPPSGSALGGRASSSSIRRGHREGAERMEAAQGGGEAPVVWVTGAGSGMGRASALTLAEGGRRVVLSGRRQEVLESVAVEVRATGGEALVLPLDVGDRDAVAHAAGAARERWGRLDGLVLASGANVRDRAWPDLSLAELED